MDLQMASLLLVFTFLLAISGVALYRATNVDKNRWIFLALFVLYIFITPLAALASLFYLFYFSKKKLTIGEIKSWFVTK